MFGSFGAVVPTSSTLVAQPAAAPTEIIQYSTPFAKLPASIQEELKKIDSQLQKHSMSCGSVERLLEDADRSEQFSVVDISHLGQRLHSIELRIKTTKKSVLFFRDQVRHELKYGEQAQYSYARLKHKSVHQMWPQLPSRYFWDKVEEFRVSLSSLTQDIEDVQLYLNATSTPQSTPAQKILHSLLSSNHNELVGISSEVARIHLVVNQMKELFIERKISNKVDPFKLPEKLSSEEPVQQQLLLLGAPPVQQQQAQQQQPGSFGNFQQAAQQPGLLQSGGLFGAAQPQTGGLFGQQQPGGMFGVSSQQQTGGLFGAAQQQPKPSLFSTGQPSTFGQPATSGVGQQSSFGNQQTPSFGQQMPASTFGQPATTQSFGQSSSLFGQPQQQQQQQQQQPSGLFGSGSTGGLFGSQTTPSAAPATGGLFGSQPGTSFASGGMFGSQSATSAASGGMFGSQSASAAPATGGMFGSQPAPSPSPFGGFQFGAR